MALIPTVSRFYRELCREWNKNQGLKSLCESACSQFVDSFEATHLTLFVSHQSKWKLLLNMAPKQTDYFYPPVDIDNHTDIPFYLINQTMRNNRPNITEHNGVQRLWLPLERKARALGCLVVDMTTEAKLSPDDFQMLSALLASELEGRLLNETAHDEYSYRRNMENELFNSQNQQRALLEQLQALHDMSSLMSKSQSMAQLLEKTVSEGKKMLHIDRMGVLLFDQDGGVIRGSYGTDIRGETIDESYFVSPLADHPLAKKTLEEKQYLLFQENVPLYQDMCEVGTGWNGYVTLWNDKKLLGWIAVDNLLSGTSLQGYHKHILKQFGVTLSQHMVARQAEDALLALNLELEKRVEERTLQLEQANTELERLSREDPLTGVANRRVFDTTLQSEWRRTERHRLPLSLLIVDVDFFKLYNDSFGHEQGDACLQRIAQLLQGVERRAGALFARLGGEEFAYILSGFDEAAARYTAENLVRVISEAGIAHKTEQGIVTVSVGVATVIPQSSQDPKSLYISADKALYQAKSEGRNRVCDAVSLSPDHA
uniref:GGDEF domain-containing protein n=1 Tax=Thaumasiovibrio occultus TaxID=1891184 RepID=UPI000B35857F|nr:GGDEF domain-containing protein [Thaumasiovibrio occultus]